MRTSDLKPSPKNPRVVTDAKLAQLKKTMDAYGDLSGVVFNRRSGNLVGGTQRSKQFPEDAEVTITKRFEKPTKRGTVAMGYVLVNGERFTYREVDWDKHRETAARIAANKNAGDWDAEELSKQIRELSSFDVDFNLELTGFDEGELRQFQPIEEFVAEEHWTEVFEPPPGEFKFIVTIKNEKRKNEFLNLVGIKTIKKKTGKVWSVHWPENG